MASERSRTGEPTSTITELPSALGKTMVGNDQLEVTVVPEPAELASRVTEPDANAMIEAQPCTLESRETKAAVSRLVFEEAELLVPLRPVNDEKWPDIAESDWTDPNAWLHRGSIIILYKLSHSKYYRLMKEWANEGVRHLLANAPGHLGRTKLFYRGDVDKRLKGDTEMAHRVVGVQAEAEGQGQKPTSEPAFAAKLLGGMLGESGASPSSPSPTQVEAARTQQQAQVSEFISKQGEQMASLHEIITKQNEQLSNLQQQNVLFQELLEQQQGQLKTVTAKVSKLEKEKKAKNRQTTMQKQMASQSAAMLEITNRLAQLG